MRGEQQVVERDVERVPAGAQREALLHRIRADHGAIVGSLAGARLNALLALPLTLGQLKVLLHVVSSGRTTAAALAADLGVSTAAVSPVVAELVDRGLLERSVDERDRRVRRLGASRRGADLVRDVFGDGWAARPLLDAVGTEGLTALAEGLAAVRAAAETRSG